MINKIRELGEVLLLENASIIRKTNRKTQGKQIFAIQKSALRNALKLYDKRTDIINAFVIRFIFSGNPEVDTFGESEKLESESPFEESKSERTKLRRQKKYDEENQEGQGLKILTPNQMLSRLPITLAQLKAGNNPEKLKNETRQLLYSLYRSKTVYKHSIIII